MQGDAKGSALTGNKRQKTADGAGLYLDLDVSQAQYMVDFIRTNYSTRAAADIMFRAFERTKSHISKYLSKALPKEYKVKPSFIKKQIQMPDYDAWDSLNPECIIPISGERMVTGGNTKTNGARVTGGTGRNYNKAGKRYKIYAHTTVKTAPNALPPRMEHQGNQPPFRNNKARVEAYRNMVFTRTTTKSYPIARVATIGVPQMPMNRSEEDIQAETVRILIERLNHEHIRRIEKYNIHLARD